MSQETSLWETGRRGDGTVRPMATFFVSRTTQRRDGGDPAYGGMGMPSQAIKASQRIDVSINGTTARQLRKVMKHSTITAP